VRRILIGVFCMQLLALGVALAQSAAPAEEPEHKRVSLRFAVGATYVNGFRDVVDYYEDTYGLSATTVPIGVSFNMTVQIAHGNAIASIPTIGIGPVAMILTSETISGYGYSGSYSTHYVDIPVTATYGLKFLPHGPVGPYVRGGIAYHATVSDVVDSSTPGFIVAAGVDLLQNHRANIQIEGAYDASKVKFKGIYSYYGLSAPKEIKTGAAMISMRVVF
jgi:hypothetical protein